MNKFVGGVDGGHNRYSHRIPECFLQAPNSAGQACGLGADSMESDEVGRFDRIAILEGVGGESDGNA